MPKAEKKKELVKRRLENTKEKKVGFNDNYFPEEKGWEIDRSTDS